MKFKEKTEAISLRKAGHSLKKISKKLHVSKSTASLWLKNIEISPEARIKIDSAYRKGTLLGLAAIQKRWSAIRESSEKEAERKAKKVLDSLALDTSYCKLSCALIFWCEGTKNGSEVRFTNSDPSLIQTFLSLLRKGFDIKEERLRALVHVHEYHDEEVQKNFWSRVTEIPLNQFNRSYHKPNTGKIIREGYQGCLSIRYADGGKTLHELKSLYKQFSKLLDNQ